MIYNASLAWVCEARVSLVVPMICNASLAWVCEARVSLVVPMICNASLAWVCEAWVPGRDDIGKPAGLSHQSG